MIGSWSNQNDILIMKNHARTKIFSASVIISSTFLSLFWDLCDCLLCERDHFFYVSLFVFISRMIVDWGMQQGKA